MNALFRFARVESRSPFHCSLDGCPASGSGPWDSRRLGTRPPQPGREPSAGIRRASPAAQRSSSTPEPPHSLCAERTPSSPGPRARFLSPVRPSVRPHARPSGCASPRARLLCRRGSRRGGGPAAPPWGRSRWSARTSLGRCAPGAASGRHTWQRRAQRRVSGSAGRPGGGAARARAAAGGGAAGGC